MNNALVVFFWWISQLLKRNVSDKNHTSFNILTSNFLTCLTDDGSSWKVTPLRTLVSTSSEFILKCKLFTIKSPQCFYYLTFPWHIYDPQIFHLKQLSTFCYGGTCTLPSLTKPLIFSTCPSKLRQHRYRGILKECFNLPKQIIDFKF